MSARESSFERRKRRNRFNVKNKTNKPRLCVHRTNKNIYVQLIDSEAQVIASASTLSEELSGKVKSASNIDAAKAVGELISKKVKAAKITNDVVFDRGAFRYHGRVQALAEAARAGGLKF